MAITKKQIKSELSEIKILNKSFSICIGDYDLRRQLLIKRAQKFLKLIDKCEERNLYDFELEALKDLKDDIKIHMRSNDEIYTADEFKLNAVLNSGETIIQVIVLE